MTPGFIGNPLDRVDHLRLDAEAVAALVGDWRVRLLVLDGLDPVFADDGGLSWTSLADLPDTAEPILLGLADGRPRFAAVPADPPLSELRHRGSWGALELLPAGEAAIYGTARSVIDWHGRHRFCPRCGAPTTVFRAGWGRKCTADGSEHYPRTDPVVIMLAEHDDRVLLGRQAAWPAGRYSALAGFLEPGESIEEAVARELYEEARVVVGKVRYLASQPWPFPSQLMIGAVAEVGDAAFTLDPTELEDALWVSRAEVRAALAEAPNARFLAPPRLAIAHTLLALWADG